MLLDANENRLMQHYGFRHTMVIRSAARADFGNYSCSAENSLGRSRAFIEVSGELLHDRPTATYLVLLFSMSCTLPHSNNSHTAKYHCTGLKDVLGSMVPVLQIFRFRPLPSPRYRADGARRKRKFWTRVPGIAVFKQNVFISSTLELPAVAAALILELDDEHLFRCRQFRFLFYEQTSAKSEALKKGEVFSSSNLQRKVRRPLNRKDRQTSSFYHLRPCAVPRP